MEVGPPHVDGGLLGAEHGRNDGDESIGDVVGTTGVREDADVAPPPFRDGDAELVAHTILARIAVRVRFLGEDRDDIPTPTREDIRKMQDTSNDLILISMQDSSNSRCN